MSTISNFYDLNDKFHPEKFTSQTRCGKWFMFQNVLRIPLNIQRPDIWKRPDQIIPYI